MPSSLVGMNKIKCPSDFLTRKSWHQSTSRSSLYPQSCAIYNQKTSLNQKSLKKFYTKFREPPAWADRKSGRAKMVDSVAVKLCLSAKFPNLKRHVKEDIKPLITTFLKCQLIWLCQIIILYRIYEPVIKLWKTYIWGFQIFILCLQLFLETYSGL